MQIKWPIFIVEGEEIFKVSLPAQLHSLVEVEDVESSFFTAYDAEGQILKLSVESDEKSWSFLPSLIRPMMVSSKVSISPTGQTDRESLKSVLVNELTQRSILVDKEESLEQIVNLLLAKRP